MTDTNQHPDHALLTAEAELRALRGQFRAAGDAGADDDVLDPIWEQIEPLISLISTTSPLTLAGAAVKLRLLADPDIGAPAGMSGDDDRSLRQISFFATAAAAAAEPPVAPDAGIIEAGLLELFREWIRAQQRAYAALQVDPSDNNPDALAAEACADGAATAIIEIPAAGVNGLAIKVYLLMYAMLGGGRPHPAALWKHGWKQRPGDNLIPMLARDLGRLVPELWPLVTELVDAAEKR